MNTSPRMGVLGIGVANFQAVREYTWLPIGPLTLLYGPNSSGKSLIVDALDIAAQVWSNEEHLGETRLWRDARVPTEDERDDQPNRIDVEVRVAMTTETFNALVGQALSGLADYFCRDLIARARIAAFNEPGVHGADGFVLEVEGEPLYERTQPGTQSDDQAWVRLKLSHPAFREETGIVGEVLDDAKRPGSCFALHDGWVTLPPAELDQGNRLDLSSTDLARVASGEGGLGRLLKFKLLHDLITVGLGRGIGRACRLGKVPASRTVPRAQELAYHFTDFEDMPPQEGFNIGLLAGSERAEFRGLAKAFLARDADRSLAEAGESDLRTVPTDHGPAPAKEHLVQQYVNRVLREHLFLDNGYQVTARVSYLRGRGQFAGSAPSTELGALEFECPSIVELALKDAHGRQFDFTDVGSGLGYLLPVLVKAFESGQSFIQQPELHLHPALQSELGDVFIELAIEGERSLLIESHSEHMLLRILRRVRESSDPSKGGTGMKITPRDVVVLYFDPQPQGFTKVRHLRVAANGDFMDPWPKGFFDSRNKDLFDE